MDCTDVKCPIHGNLKTRGNVFEGVVVSNKNTHTAIISRDYIVPLKKYERYLRKRSRIQSHNPMCINAHKGDIVRIEETRRLSKTKSFVITAIIKKGDSS